MKTNADKYILLIVALGVGQHCYSQGFVNLDFEGATVVFANPPFTQFIYASNAIPGWSAYTGSAGNPTNSSSVGSSIIGYDTEALDGGGVFLEDINAPAGNGSGGFSLRPIQGNFSVLLEGASLPAAQTEASIGQTGTIPITAQSLTFWGNQNNGNLQVTFNGQPLSLMDISNALNYTIWGANISAYAGQTGQLLFTAPVQNAALIDNVQFSSLPVPEPGVLSLLGLGGLSFLWHRRKAKAV